MKGYRCDEDPNNPNAWNIFVANSWFHALWSKLDDEPAADVVEGHSVFDPPMHLLAQELFDGLTRPTSARPNRRPNKSITE